MTETVAAPGPGRRPDGTGSQTEAGEQHGTERRHAARATIPVPHLTLPRLSVWHVPVPRVSPGGVGGDLLVLGGLAAVTALGVIEWPVAAVVGAGVLIAERRAKAVASARTR